jgi:hypothetical protein
MSQTTQGPVGWLHAVVVDCEDPERVSDFWPAVLGVGIYEVEQGAMRLHPDIEVADMDVAQGRIEALGGRLVDVIQEPDGDSHRRMADPEGQRVHHPAPVAGEPLVG